MSPDAALKIMELEIKTRVLATKYCHSVTELLAKIHTADPPRRFNRTIALLYIICCIFVVPN